MILALKLASERKGQVKAKRIPAPQPGSVVTDKSRIETRLTLVEALMRSLGNVCQSQ